MFSVPFLGPEGLSSESRNRFCAGLEVTGFSSGPTPKVDAGRLASKRQCNHILSIQPESLVSLSCMAGMWHGCAKIFAAEQAFNGLKPSLKNLDAVKQSPKAPTIQFFTGGKRSTLSSSRPKLPIRNFEEQLAVLERIHLQSQAPCNDSESSETVQEKHRADTGLDQKNGNHHAMTSSETQSSKSPDNFLQQSLEKQFNGVTSSDLQLDCSHPGLVQFAEGHEPVWNEPFLGVRRGQADKNHTIGTSLGINVQKLQLLNSPSSVSHLPASSIGNESNAAKDRSQINEEDIDIYRVGGRLQHDSAHCLDGDNLHLGEKSLINGCYSHLAARLAGSVKGIHLQVQGHGAGCLNADDEVSTSAMVEGMQAEDVVDAIGSSYCKVASVRMPTYRMASPLQRSLSDSIFYLESLGVDCSRLFRDDPSSMKCTVKQLRTLVCALEHHGLKANDFGRIFNLCPKVLHVKPDSDLRAVTDFFFEEAGLSRKDFGKVIRRCPRLLVAHVQQQLRPTLSFLRNLGYSKMGHVIANNPTLLSFSVDRKLIPKLKFLESLGFTYREAASMVVRFPAIFNYSITDNLQPKYDYLMHEMGGRNKDLLAFPQYFGYSLETRIRPRHECIAKLGVPLSIQAILKLSDAEFEARFLSGGQQEHLLFQLPETSSTMRQDCGLDTVQFASFEHVEFRSLVTV